MATPHQRHLAASQAGSHRRTGSLVARPADLLDPRAGASADDRAEVLGLTAAAGTSAESAPEWDPDAQQDRRWLSDDDDGAEFYHSDDGGDSAAASAARASMGWAEQGAPALPHGSRWLGSLPAAFDGSALIGEHRLGADAALYLATQLALWPAAADEEMSGMCDVMLARTNETNEIAELYSAVQELSFETLVRGVRHVRAGAQGCLTIRVNGASIRVAGPIVPLHGGGRVPATSTRMYLHRLATADYFPATEALPGPPYLAIAAVNAILGSPERARRIERRGRHAHSEIIRPLTDALKEVLES